MEHFTPIASLAGGLLIGLSASIVLLCYGRVAGVSGILGGVLSPEPGDFSWRAAFLLGLLSAGVATAALHPAALRLELQRSLPTVAVAGLLVGYGSRLGSGCTSGHGVCGLARRSPRSLLATLTFMATAAATVFVAQHVLGGAL